MSWRTGRWLQVQGIGPGVKARGPDPASLPGWAGIAAMNDLAAALYTI
jgi:hypothetical protein